MTRGGSPLLTIGEVLSLSVLAPARPEVVHGHDLLDRRVRWVHTSEIAGIAPLLKGGELLLTTGLGLRGAPARDQTRYVEQLADRQVAAVFLELGRTFSSVPPAVQEAARKRDLVLVALHGVVPFVEVTEAVHARLLSRRLDDLARADAVTQALNEVLLGGGGLEPLLRRASELAGAPARVTGPDGRVIATSDSTSFGPDVALRPRPRAPVTVFGRPWGHVELDLAPDTAASLLLQRLAVAVGIELLRTGETANPQLLARHALLTDLATGRAGSPRDVRARADLVGVTPPDHMRVRGLVVQLDEEATVRSFQDAAETAARRVFGYASLAIVDHEALGVISIRGSDPRDELERFIAMLDSELLRGAGRVRAAAAGPAADAVEELAPSLARAREACELSLQLAMGRRVLLASDVAVLRLLQQVDDTALEHLIEEQLGSLIEHDAAHRGDLLATLEVYARTGANKTVAAERLRVRRQTLYARLERIERITGEPLDHDRLLSLELALTARRLRTAGRARPAAAGSSGAIAGSPSR